MAAVLKTARRREFPRGFESHTLRFGLPTELPVLCRQNCGGDLVFSMAPGSDIGAGCFVSWPESAGGLLRGLLAGFGRGWSPGLKVIEVAGLVVRVSCRGGSRAGWPGAVVLAG